MSKNPLFPVFLIIFTTLFLIAFIRFAFDADPISFYSMLLNLQNAPLIDFSSVLDIFHIGGNWGMFDFLRDLLNSFGGVLGFLSFVVLNLYNMLLFILYFYKTIFI